MRINFFVIFLAFLPLFASANVVGTDTQNFNPSTSGLDFITVQSSETLDPGILNFGLFFNYAVNTLPYYDSTGSQNHSTFNDTLLSADLNVGIGLLPNWDLGASFPHILNQTVDEQSPFHGQFANTGSTEFRFNSKYRFLKTDTYGLALIGTVNIDRIIDNPFTGIGAGPTYNLELAYDRKLMGFDFAFNVGHRWRNPGTPVAGVPITPFNNQFIASVGTNYYLPKYDSKLILEIFASFPEQQSDFGVARNRESAELIGGLKYDLTRNIAFHVGGGTELFHGNATPDWRVFTGINWVMGPIFANEEVFYRYPVTTLSFQQDPFATAPQAKEETFVMQGLIYATNSDKLFPAGQKELNRIVEYVTKPGRTLKKLVVEGHTDSIGSASYNLSLSKRRAINVRKYLVNSLKLPARKVKAVGYGEEKPIASNGNFQGRQRNRRVQFRVTWQ